MRHELARQLRGNHVDMDWAEGEAGAKPMQEPLDVAIGDEIPLAGRQKQLEGLVLETENGYRKHHHHGDDAEQHSAEHFEVSAEGQHVRVGVIVRLRLLVLARLLHPLLLRVFPPKARSCLP